MAQLRAIARFFLTVGERGVHDGFRRKPQPNPFVFSPSMPPYLKEMLSQLMQMMVVQQNHDTARIQFHGGFGGLPGLVPDPAEGKALGAEIYRPGLPHTERKVFFVRDNHLQRGLRGPREKPVSWQRVKSFLELGAAGPDQH
jgi:hypothetical protein